MKKVSLFLLAGIAVMAASCKGGENTEDKTIARNGDAIEAIPFEPTTNIRYVVSDSIQSNYVFAEETQQKLQQLELEYRAYESQLLTQLQNKQNEIQQKYQNNGYFSEESLKADLAKAQQMEANYQQLLAQRREETLQKSAVYAQALQDSVNNFVERYNREHHYDAILYKENCLYLNPALDITAEIVDGLNKAYHPAVQNAAPAKDATAAPAAPAAKK